MTKKTRWFSNDYSTEGLELLQGFTRIADLAPGLFLACQRFDTLWRTSRRVEQPQIPHKNRETFSLSEYIRVDELRGSACKKNSVFFTPHSLVRTLVSLVNELYCQLGDKRLPYHLLQEPNKKSLMVCQNSVPNSWSHSWHECPKSAVCCRSLIPLQTCRRKENGFRKVVISLCK